MEVGSYDHKKFLEQANAASGLALEAEDKRKAVRELKLQELANSGASGVANINNTGAMARTVVQEDGSTGRAKSADIAAGLRQDSVNTTSKDIQAARLLWETPTRDAQVKESGSRTRGNNAVANTEELYGVKTRQSAIDLNNSAIGLNREQTAGINFNNKMDKLFRPKILSDNETLSSLNLEHQKRLSDLEKPQPVALPYERSPEEALSEYRFNKEQQAGYNPLTKGGTALKNYSDSVLGTPEFGNGLSDSLLATPVINRLPGVQLVRSYLARDKARKQYAKIK